MEHKCEHVGVDAAGDGGGTVSQRLADVEHRHAQVVGDGSKGMPQVVQPDLLQTVVHEELREQLRDVVGAIWPAICCISLVSSRISASHLFHKPADLVHHMIGSGIVQHDNNHADDDDPANIHASIIPQNRKPCHPHCAFSSLRILSRLCPTDLSIYGGYNCRGIQEIRH